MNLSDMHYAEVTDASIPAFITKLWHMVTDSSTDDLICWGQEETSFVIKNEQRFCLELLPRYYKHNNMSSFIRQLNKYDFHKVVSAESLSLKSAIDKPELEFVHPYFIKDHPELLSRIKRKLSNSKDVPEFKGDHNMLTKVVKEVQQLQAKQKMVLNSMKAMQAENNALWREHSILKQKHHNQQKIINKDVAANSSSANSLPHHAHMRFILTFFLVFVKTLLVQFLVSLVRGMNIRGGIPLMVKENVMQPMDGLKAIKARDFAEDVNPTICEVDNSSQPLKDNSLDESIAEFLTPKTESHINKFALKRKMPLIKEVNEAKKVKQENQIEVPTLDISELPLEFDLTSPQSFPVVTSPSGVVMHDFVDDNSKSGDTIPAATESNPGVQTSSVSEPVTGEAQTFFEPDVQENLLADSTNMQTQLEGIQDDLDALKDILKGGNLNFDAETIMNLFDVDGNIFDTNTADEEWSNNKLILGKKMMDGEKNAEFSLGKSPNSMTTERRPPVDGFIDLLLNLLNLLFTSSEDAGTELVPYGATTLLDILSPGDPVSPQFDSKETPLSPLTSSDQLETPLSENLLDLENPHDV